MHSRRAAGRLPATRLLRCAAGLLALFICSLPTLADDPANAARGAASGGDRPNVIVLLADDLGYAELGCQGNRDIPTPHIDSLAAEGVRFTSGYVSAPFCSASRAGLLTGRYQTRFGYEFNPIGAENFDPRIGLPDGTVTIAARLREAGYATGLIGKWHQGGTPAHHPQRRGFDEFYGFLHEGHYYLPVSEDRVTSWLRRRTLPDGGQGRWTSADGRLILSTQLRSPEPAYDADNPIQRNGQPVHETEYLTDALTRESVEFIRRHRERPFFLYVAYNAVHSPMQALQEDLDRFAHLEDIQRRIFAAMLHRLDQSVGEILSTLNETGLDQRTQVWFLSDNGGPTHELTSSNHPLRGRKSEFYEGGIRVPFLLKWPGVAPAGQVEDRAVSSLDIFATSVAAAAGADSLPANLDGMDLRPWLTGERTDLPHPTLYWRSGDRSALRHGDWKVVRHPVPRNRPGTWELYHLATDLSETTDLSRSDPTKRDELIQLWEALDREMSPAVWTRRN